MDKLDRTDLTLLALMVFLLSTMALVFSCGTERRLCIFMPENPGDQAQCLEALKSEPKGKCTKINHQLNIDVPAHTWTNGYWINEGDDHLRWSGDDVEETERSEEPRR